MRRFAIGLFIGLLMLVYSLPALAASSVVGTPNGHGPIRGIVKAKGQNQAALPFAGSGKLTYHGGPVMHTNKTFAIYWVPSGFSVSTNYQSTINKFFQDVAASSGSTSNVYYSTTQYYDNTKGNILHSSSFGGAYLDTNPFPSSGCTDSVSQTTICLSDAQLQAEIDRVVALKGWPRGATNMFFMFTAKNVGSCYDNANCAFSQFCAYHSDFGTGANLTIYANQPYATTVSSGCDTGQRPNNDDADATINVTSHEHAEAITDYNGDAWYDASGYENGDKCAWTFGTALGGSTGHKYNQVLGTGHYYLQREWSNATNKCLLTGK
ncbi:MAG: hypothetical protein JST60_00035 [Chloroflexi bacterium SZAS-1]|nr:hypothetical protein [Chloroflexi bacterium SZAS-1]